MSAPPSPKPSFESEDRPSTSESAQPAKRAGHTRSISFEDAKPRDYSPRRRSIQFNVGSAEAQLPTRTPTFKEKRLSFGGGLPIREEHKEPEQERDLERHHSARGPSPPPPKYVGPSYQNNVRTDTSQRTYERGVSFDTFDNRDAPNFSLTLNYKHKGYQSTRRSRTFLCGTDQNDYSEFG
jgi:hypothetical protein